MPLTFDAQQAWPPLKVGGLDFSAVRRDLAKADAWYSGDPDKLRACYPKATEGGPPSIEARVASWMTGNAAKARDLLHLPIAADLAAMGADLLFGKTPGFVIPEAHEDTDLDDDGKRLPPSPEATKAIESEARLNELIELDGIDSTLSEAAEIAGGLGGVYLRPMWDKSLAGHAMLTTVHPDYAVPEFRHGRLLSVTFWSVVRIDGQSVWRHLEKHAADGTWHGLYIGTKEHLGRKVKLTDHEATKSIEAGTDGRVALLAGIIGLDVRYVPNMLPNPAHRGFPIGRSDTGKPGIDTLMRSLDIVWTSWMRDIRLAKGRITVPDMFLTKGGRGQGATWDEDQEVYVGLSVDPNAQEKAGITISQFEIRSDEHAATAKALVEQISRSGGYAPQSFGVEVEGGGIQTATEVEARTDLSERTTGRKQRYWDHGLPDALYILQVIDREVFGSKAEPMRPRIVWAEQDQDQEALAKTLVALAAAEAASIETRVRMVHPDWDQTQIDREVTAIKEERGTAPDPTGGFPA